jgi:serine/threonine-protein kinase RsbW
MPAFVTRKHTTVRPLELTNLVLDSLLENADSVESATLEIARRAGFSGADVEKIGLAAREIVANAIIHGNRLDLHKKVIVTILRTNKRLEITVVDEGSGFEPDNLPDPRSAEVLLRKSGRGIYLARSFMDEFHVHIRPQGGATVTLIKYICCS